MKQKSILTRTIVVLMLLIGSVGILYAQTDVTSTYLNNATFDEDANFPADTSEVNLVTNDQGANSLAVEGWTLAGESWRASATFEYGSAAILNSDGPVPSAGSDGTTTGAGHAALGISVAWGGNTTYSQNATLPAGTYKIMYKVYNSFAGSTAGSSLVGWVPESGSSVLSELEAFPSEVWTSDTVEFVLTEETTGKFQVGIQGVNSGSSGNARVFFDDLKVEYTETLPALLSSITPSVGKLEPAFNAAITEYVVYAPLGSSSVMLTATAEDEAFSVDGEMNLDITSDADTTTLTVSGDGNISTEYTIVAVPVMLKHGYTFEDGTVSDQVGDLDGQLVGSNITAENGRLIVSGATTPTDGYVTFDAAALALNTYNAITLEFQIQSYEMANSSFTMLAYFGNNTGGNRTLWYQPARSGNESRAEISTGGGSASAGLAGTEIDDGLFHHVVVIARADTLYYYLDGAEVAKAATSGNPIPDIDTQIAQLFKGADGWGDPNYNAELEEFNIFNGALDEASIAERARTFDNDGDGIVNSIDNCPDVVNPDQGDFDEDGVGNICDDDWVSINLSEIAVDAGSLNPQFDPFTMDYTLALPMGVTSANVTATAESESATVTGGGAVDASAGEVTVDIEVGNGDTTNTYSVRVIPLMIKHGYAFDTDVTDGIGDLDGTIQGTGSVVDGAFVSASGTDGITFDGAALDLASYGSITLETFIVSTENNPAYHMINYFGGNTGSNAYWVQPARGNDVAQNEFNGSAIVADFEVADDKYHHLVSTLTNDEMAFYIDGELIGTIDPSTDISAIDPTNAYLCLSGWPDASWQGRILEFNIYNGVMNAEDVASRADMFDADGDGIIDSEDDDRDGDAVVNSEDNCPDTPNPDQEDLDGDGIGDVCDDDMDGDEVANDEDNCPMTANTDQADIDEDGIGDVCDDDMDGDEVVNDEDNCPMMANTDQADLDQDGVGDVCDDDMDGDEVANEEDNCPMMANADQADLDGDGLGDLCDEDDDGDGVLDDLDSCPATPQDETANDDGCSPSQVDTDEDGVFDDVDNCIETSNPDQLDTDEDGIGDVCDDDLDGDGVNNDADNCPLVANADQLDSDGDGEGDVCDDTPFILGSGDINDYQIYPNPVVNALNVILPSGIERDRISIQVFGINGKEMLLHFNVETRDEIQLDLSSLESGMYFIRIDAGEGLKSFKVLKK